MRSSLLLVSLPITSYCHMTMTVGQLQAEQYCHSGEAKLYLDDPFQLPVGSDMGISTVYKSILETRQRDSQTRSINVCYSVCK